MEATNYKLINENLMEWCIEKTSEPADGFRNIYPSFSEAKVAAVRWLKNEIARAKAELSHARSLRKSDID